MRLLHVRSLNFTEFHDDAQRPKYAIASHRWCVDEAKFRDVEQGRNKDSAGFKKVEAFAKFVNDNVKDIEWLWIDTCCINKDSDAELSYSINSMFKWYRNADLCIAYLTTQNLESLEQDEWFRRGWTLQELLAPRLVLFVAQDWHIIGNKGSSTYKYDGTLTGPDLTAIIAKTTSIPEAVLHDWSNSTDVQVEDKMAWIEDRKTTREEDMSYALFGILGITLNVIYGEGQQSARNRLISELRRRNEAENAHIMESRRREELEKENAEEWREITEWLDPPNPWTNHESARKLHEQQTGNWLLESSKYLAWKSGSHGQGIWLHGVAGCGKTVLCSTAISDMRRYCKESPRNLGLAIFYFSFTDRRKQTYEDLLLTLVAQLASKGPGFTTLKKAFNAKDRKLPGHEDLEQILRMTLSSYDTVFCLLDALDESPENGGARRRLLERVGELLNDAPNFRILITSRDESDIRRSMTQLKCTPISVASNLVTPDILRYIGNEISRVPKLSRLDAVTKIFVKATLSDRADGMFRFVACQLQELAKTKSTRPNSVKKALLALPATLDETYERILCRIDPDDQPYALTLLRWLAYSYEPLTLEQLAEASVIDPGDNDSDGVVDIDNKGDWADTLELLAGLVVPITDDRPASLASNHQSARDDKGYTTNTGEQEDGASSADDYATALPMNQHINERTKVRLAHFSVKEYLESSRIMDSNVREYGFAPGREHRFLTHSCLAYLTYYSESRRKLCSKGDSGTFTLLNYTAKRWWDHAKEQNYANTTREVRFLMNDRYKHDSLRVFNPRRPYPDWFGYEPDSEDDPILPYASSSNLHEIVKGLLAAGENIDNQNEELGGALYAAVDAGHETMCRLLLEKGADVNLQGGPQRSTLVAAAHHGLETILVMLLDAKARVERLHNNATHEMEQGVMGQRNLKVSPPEMSVELDINLALNAAVHHEHERIVQILVMKGADVNTRDDDGTPLLAQALIMGNDRIIQTLLVGGADIYAETNARQTILATASRWGRDNHVRGLLDAEADPNIPSTAGKTALHEASKYGWIRIVQMLLDAGADASKVDERGRNALTLALASGHEQVAQALWTVTSGMSRKEIYGKALIEASRHGMTTQGVVSLLKAGADALFVDEHGANALLGALENGFAGELIMRDLVEAVPDLPQRELYHVLLSSDLGCWPEETALVLLTAITDTLPDTTYREALTTASRWGYTEIVQKLLEMMPYVLREDVYHNALINAAKYDYIDIVQILLEAIIDIAPGEAHRTALIESVARGHVKIVQLLSKALTCGSSVDVYEEALIEASKAGRSEIVRSILAKSNAPHQQCIQQALIAAVSQPSYEGVINVHVIKTTRDRTVQILLDAGVDVNAPAGQYKSDSSGAAPEPRKKGHSLPLHAAAAFHRAVLVDMLLDAGADVHARDHNEDTALQVVSHQGCDCWSCKTIKQMLLAAGARQVP